MFYKMWFMIGKKNGFLIRYLKDHYRFMKEAGNELKKDKRISA